MHEGLRINIFVYLSYFGGLMLPNCPLRVISWFLFLLQTVEYDRLIPKQACDLRNYYKNNIRIIRC